MHVLIPFTSLCQGIAPQCLTLDMLLSSHHKQKLWNQKLLAKDIMLPRKKSIYIHINICKHCKRRREKKSKDDPNSYLPRVLTLEKVKKQYYNLGSFNENEINKSSSVNSSFPWPEPVERKANILLMCFKTLRQRKGY